MSEFWAGLKFTIMAFCISLAMGLGFCLSAVMVFDPDKIEDYKQKARELEMERDCGEIRAVGLEGVQMKDGTSTSK